MEEFINKEGYICILSSEGSDFMKVNNGVDFIDTFIDWYDKNNIKSTIKFIPEIEEDNDIVWILIDGEYGMTTMACCGINTWKSYGFGNGYIIKRGGVHNQNIIGEYC